MKSDDLSWLDQVNIHFCSEATDKSARLEWAEGQMVVNSYKWLGLYFNPRSAYREHFSSVDSTFIHVFKCMRLIL